MAGIPECQFSLMKADYMPDQVLLYYKTVPDTILKSEKNRQFLTIATMTVLNIKTIYINGIFIKIFEF